MKRFASLLLAILFLAVGTTVRAQAPPKRNIIFILIDDMRFDSTSLLGHPFLETPSLDSLAKSGIIFENTFVTTSLCSPSRASILTGTYAHKHQILDNNTDLPDTTPTFPKELQKAGYETAFIGKWHMGGSRDAPRPGFDRWASFKGQGVYENPTFNVDGKPTPREGYVTDIITDYALDFLAQKHEKPFFLYVSHEAVHADFKAAPRHRGSYSGKVVPHPASMANTEENYKGKPNWVRAQRESWHGVDGMYNNSIDFDKFAIDYAETLRAVDDSVGKIMDSLRKSGMLDSTLIVFTSDNGFQFGEHGLIDKRTMYEASIKVPLFVSCPQLFAGGQRRKEMILNVDFAPTFLEVASAAIPAGVQGRSFYPLLAGKETKWRNAFLYEYFWERSFPQTPTVLGVRTDRYKFMKFQGVWDRYEIYDLQNDPDEMHNLIGDFITGHNAGNVEYLVQTKAPPDLKKLFNDLNRRLNEQLKETGCAEEANWRPLQQ